MIDVALKIRSGSFSLDANFRIPSTGITAISGPSGSGKTSFLRAIAGLDRHVGRVAVNGVVWQEGARFLPVHYRKLGYVSQEPSLLPHLSVRGNLEFARKRHPGSANFEHIVAMSGVGPILSRAVHKLSGGERQRVAIARALLTSPRLLIMDEPLSSLNTESKSDLIRLIAKLSESEGLPTLYVTHDKCEMAALAHRFLRVEAGRIKPAPVPNTVKDSLAGMSQKQIEALASAALKVGLSPQRE